MCMKLPTNCYVTNKHKTHLCFSYIISCIFKQFHLLIMSKIGKFAPHLKELRVHLCQTSESSKGLREFIEKSYVDLKTANPKLPILVRECKGVQPRVWARYEKGKESTAALTGVKCDDIPKKLKELVKRGEGL